ncbi:hypothetical protein [Streptomyces sp. NPDC059215]|uniref:hypothetical protein n=1 Tax=Streptomyces sp. NPDC059215 TaxID=3346772 RepID=UPI00367F5302
MAENNVRLPPCAFDALAAIAVRWRTSRDETVRRLLAEHVKAQEELAPDDRLTHISTVLRYPPRPLWRKAPRADRPLRLRTSEGLVERARAVSLRLPGQYARSHRDYQARTLTDAVMTAIAVAEPFTDDFLDGLRPLLSHRAALSLWRLTTAATATGPEKAVLVEADRVRAQAGWVPYASAHAENGSDESSATHSRHVQLVAEALENDVAWHSPERFKVAANIARSLLTGPGAEAGERLLYEEGTDWHELYQDTLHAAGDRQTALLEGTTRYDFSGRGGSAVWRARRQVALQDFEDWLLSPPGNDVLRKVDPPGWMLHLPAGWHAHAPALTAGGPSPAPHTQWADEGKLLRFPFRNRQAFWPLTRPTRARGWTPVPGIEPLVAAAASLRPAQISGFIEAVLIDWAHEFEIEDEPAVRIGLDLPVDKAHAFGFLTAEEQHQSMAEARARTKRAMDAVIDAMQDDDERDEERLQLLRDTRGNARKFKSLARQFDKRIGSKFMVARATWLWPGRSVADTLLAGERPDLVQWLATWAHRSSTRILEYSMQDAWDRAFDQYSRRM